MDVCFHVDLEILLLLGLSGEDWAVSRVSSQGKLGVEECAGVREA